jgi:hypothetical protein
VAMRWPVNSVIDANWADAQRMTPNMVGTTAAGRPARNAAGGCCTASDMRHDLTRRRDQAPRQVTVPPLPPVDELDVGTEA